MSSHVHIADSDRVGKKESFSYTFVDILCISELPDEKVRTVGSSRVTFWIESTHVHTACVNKPKFSIKLFFKI